MRESDDMPGGQPMTSRHRWQAAMTFQPVDRLPFWPKVGPEYLRVQQSPFRDMSVQAFHQWIGSDMLCGIGIAESWKEMRKTTSVETTDRDSVSRTVYRTPYGEMESVRHFDEQSQSWRPVRFPVQDREDIRRMIAVYRDVSVELDAAAARCKTETVRHRFGEHAFNMNPIGSSPLMSWVKWVAGVEQGQYLLADYTEEVEDLFDAMQQELLQRIRLLAGHSVADMLYLGEDTSTTMISPQQYRRYCCRHIGEYGRLTRVAGKPLCLHMCGHLKAILPDLATVPVEAFEAFTSPTIGDTTLLDGRTHCPDKCLIGGTNAALWLQPAERIIARLEEDLDALPHHRGLVITSAGGMPPACAPETIKAVGDWLKQYPVRL